MQVHINTYGAYLHVKDQLFEIKLPAGSGSDAQRHQIAAHKVKSIWLSRGTALSSDAVHLAVQHNVDIVFLENDGYPAGRVWHSKLGSTTLIRKKQLEASLNEEAVRFVKSWLGRKLANQAGFIQKLMKHRKRQGPFLQDRVDKIEALRESILESEGKKIAELAESFRGLEGTAGRLFFETLSHVLPAQYQFAGRSSRPAADPFNAFLNYAYGILYSRVEKALIIGGLDPYLGFLHRDDYNYKSLVYDFIEPYRIFADKVVFSLFAAKKVRQDHTDRITNGFSLNKAGKVLLVEAFNQYFEEERVRYKNRNQTRANIIQLDAHLFANALIKKEIAE